MLDFGTLLSVVLFGFWVYCIVDVLMCGATDVRSLTKWAWLAVVVLVFPLFPIGGALWFGLGRPARVDGRTAFADRRERFAARPQRAPRWSRQQPADQVDEAVIRERIEERDRLLAKWAEEERRKGEQQGPAEPTA